MHIIDELKWRGLISDSTDINSLYGKLITPTTLYTGFDPTSNSLHIGNLIPLLTLKRFQDFGHKSIALIGGATGQIGDPSGKLNERSMLTDDTVYSNSDGIKKQINRILDPNNKLDLVVDNKHWINSIYMIDFLRDVGKYFSINSMLAKDSVKTRTTNSESGISYTEFSYMLLQAYDFYYLNNMGNCELQIGGSDQWGNITSGIEFIRKKTGKEAYGLTLPLLTNSDGSKFGKTVDGAVWLDSTKTSVYKFYQFWINVKDSDAIKLLRYFTFLNKSEIDAIQFEHSEKPENKLAQRTLAFEITNIVHGRTATLNATSASIVLFGGKVNNISEESFKYIINEIPNKEIVFPDVFSPPLKLVDLLVLSGLCKSKSSARIDMVSGAVSMNNEKYILLNNEKQIFMDRSISKEDLLFNKYILLRNGKKNYFLFSVKFD